MRCGHHAASPSHETPPLYVHHKYRLAQKQNKYQLSLTNLRNALRHGKRAANKGGRSA